MPHLLLYFILASAISWLLWAPLWLPAFGVEDLHVFPYHHALGALGPIVAAFAMTALDSGRTGVVDLARRLVAWRGRVHWILVALFAPAVLFLAAAAMADVVTGDLEGFDRLGISREFPELSRLGFLLYNVITFGYGEETGWRGYALPRLQKRYSAFVATLMLSVGWALWHLPLFLYRPGYTSMDLGGAIGWFASLVTGAVLLTWMFNSSRGSILVVAHFHATVDIVFTSDVSTPEVVGIVGGLITIWGIAVLGFARPRFLSREGKMVAADDGTLMIDGGDFVRRMQRRP